MLMTKARSGKAAARTSDSELKFVFDEGKEADYIVTSPDCTQLVRLEKWGRKKKMTQITFEGQASVPEIIQIQHFNFDMTIKMKKIIR